MEMNGWRAAQNCINPHNLNMSQSLSAAQVSQRFVANYVYELPFGHGKRFLSKGVMVGNGQASGVLSAQTSAPISIAAACSFAGTSRLGCHVDRLQNANPASRQRMDCRFDTTAFASPATYSFGTGSRTEPSPRNPGTLSFDTLKSRCQPIRERIRLQFRNPGVLSASITPATYGRSTRKAGIRTVQMGVRMEY